MNKDTFQPRKLASATRHAHKPRKEPLLAQIASFVDLFVWLLVLKSFFLPLFIIPTGSMAETLDGAHANYTCPNCGWEYAVNFHTPAGPYVVQCPNCRYQQETRAPDDPGGVRLRGKAGDRIVCHGWPYDIGGPLRPQRWDVVVFKNPNDPDVNYIKRLIGLPGETIEIIDGDIFVKGPHDPTAHVAAKTPYAQCSLWFPYYDHDCLPRQSTEDWVGRREYELQRQRGQPWQSTDDQVQGQTLEGGRWPAYRPRWVAPAGETGWKDLDTRTPRFDGLQAAYSQIHFATVAGDDQSPGRVIDMYGYNAYERDPRYWVSYHNVTDVRLSTDVEIQGGDGFVELSISKYDDFFYARLHADGGLTLEHEKQGARNRQQWAQTRLALPSRPIRLSLGHADYHVTVEIDGKTVLESTPEQYTVTPELARDRTTLVRRLGQETPAPLIRIGAARLQAVFAHLLIERDVYYVSGELPNRASSAVRELYGWGTQGHPIHLREDAYFVCGDNSPASYDSRRWRPEDLGPHLREAYANGTYDIGTVPADQMIGRAFFVYWPGFLPLPGSGLNLLPDLGRVRWIH